MIYSSYRSLRGFSVSMACRDGASLLLWLSDMPCSMDCSLDSSNESLGSQLLEVSELWFYLLSCGLLHGLVLTIFNIIASTVLLLLISALIQEESVGWAACINCQNHHCTYEWTHCHMNKVLSEYSIEASSNLAITPNRLGRVFLSTYVWKSIVFYTTLPFTERKRRSPVKFGLNRHSW